MLYRSTYRSWSILLLLFVLLLLAGCTGKSSGTDTAGENTGSSEQVAKEFAEALIDGDFSAAESLLTSACKSRVKLSEAYAQAVEEYAKPERVEFDEGELPSSAEEAQGYEFPPDIPLDRMKAWLVCLMANDKRQCFDIWVLVVEDGSDLKIAYYDISHPD